MPRERRQRELAFPFQLAVFGVETNQREAAGTVARGGDEEPLAPKHGRGMAAPGQLDFPANGRIGDFGRDVFAVPYARAVWAPKSGPLLARKVEREGSERCRCGYGALQ